MLHETAHWVRYQGKSTEEISAIRKDYQTLVGRAKEEMIADITSMLLARDLYLDYYPQNNLNYVSEWAKSIENRKNSYDLYKIVAEAEKRKELILGLELELELAKEVEVGALKADQTTDLSTEKIYLSVPFKEKDNAKKLGARWDNGVQLWYAPEGVDLKQFKAWMTDKKLEVSAKDAVLSPAEELVKAIFDLNGDLRGELPIMDGKIHRVHNIAGRPGNKDISYCAYDDDYPAGWVENFQTGEKAKWCSSLGHTLTDEQKQKLRKETELKSQLRAEELAKTHEQSAVKAAEYYNSMQVVPETPYTKDKGLTVKDGVRTPNGTTLAIPMYDLDEKIWALTYINQDGSKNISKDAKREGCCYVVGGLENLSSTPVIVITEGFSTAQTIHEACEIPVVSAFMANNLKHVAVAIKEKFPDKSILIAGDDDVHLVAHPKIKKNRGRLYAEEAAKAVGGIAIFPKFAVGEQKSDLTGFTDFNDLAVKSTLGIAAVKKQIEQGIEKSRTVEPTELAM